MAIDQNGRKDVDQGIHIHPMKVVNTVVDPSVAGFTEIGDIGFGEEVGNVGGWIDDGSSNDANRVWNIGTADFALQERSMHLPGVDHDTRLCIEGTNPVLRGRQKDELGRAIERRIYEWLGIKL